MASFVLSFCLLCATQFTAPRYSQAAMKLAQGIAAQTATVPRFESAACAIAVPQAEKESARCGYLIVPENRRRKNSRLIRLPLIILKSSSPNPAPDPVLRMLGGPGASSLRLVRGRNFSPWLKNRDMVILEQRGTLYAQPKLDCPEVAAAKIENARSGVDKKAAIRREVNAAKNCRERLVREGLDLAGYDSVQSAADIEDLRRVLGYEKWNLYGLSYSSRLMLNVMRDYPEGIRSVVIESVLPPSVNYDEVGVDAAARALRALFSNCAADAECAKSYPGLETTFYDLVRRTNRQPITLNTKQPSTNETVALRLDGHDITTWVLDYLLSSDAEAASSAPLQITQVAGGDYRPLKDYAESKISAGGYMWGMRYSVWCREEMPFQNRRTIAAQSFRHGGLRGYTIQASMPGICDAWGVAPSARRENEPVRSDLPTLILAGEYDAYTPPAWGRLAAQTLRHSYFKEIPGVGHGPGFHSACARQMINAFFDNPTAPPDDACLQAPRQKFTTKK